MTFKSEVISNTVPKAGAEPADDPKQIAELVSRIYNDRKAYTIEELKKYCDDFIGRTEVEV
jgi:hypothetical protein